MLKLKYNIGIMFVDYLQLATYDEAGNREQEIGRISRGLKQSQKNWTFLWSHYLSYLVKWKIGTEKTNVVDLRDSGSIEQDADEVIFIQT